MKICWLSRDSRASRPVLVLTALLLGFFGLAVRPVASAHAAGPSYTLTTLHAVTGETFTAVDSANPVNGAGLIAGYVGDSRTGNQEAAVFNTRTSSLRRLGVLVAGLDSAARDVNIRGDVVGTARVSSNVSHAFAVRAGTNTMIDLGPSDRYINSDAFSINDLGVVAGWMDDSSSSTPNRYAVTWTLGASSGFTMYNIGKAVGSTASNALAVNNGGYVLFSRWDKGPTGSFVWLPEKRYALQIKPLPGDDNIAAFDMNDAGFAVGVSADRKSGVSRPALWNSQTRTTRPLPVSPGSRATTPTAINAGGTIVGRATFVQGANSWTKPVVWSGFGATIANLPIGSNPSALAFGINVFGLVVGQPGQGLEEGTFTWSPRKS